MQKYERKAYQQLNEYRRLVWAELNPEQVESVKQQMQDIYLMREDIFAI